MEAIIKKCLANHKIICSCYILFDNFLNLYFNFHIFFHFILYLNENRQLSPRNITPHHIIIHLHKYMNDKETQTHKKHINSLAFANFSRFFSLQQMNRHEKKQKGKINMIFYVKRCCHLDLRWLHFSSSRSLIFCLSPPVLSLSHTHTRTHSLCFSRTHAVYTISCTSHYFQFKYYWLNTKIIRRLWRRKCLLFYIRFTLHFNNTGFTQLFIHATPRMMRKSWVWFSLKTTQYNVGYF